MQEFSELLATINDAVAKTIITGREMPSIGDSLRVGRAYRKFQVAMHTDASEQTTR